MQALQAASKVKPRSASRGGKPACYGPDMRLGTLILLALMSALWFYGFIDQMHSREAGMRYLALSMLIVAAVVSWKIPHPRRRRFRDRA